MANWYVKNVAGQIAGTGKQITKKVGEEPIEILKDAQSQVLIPSSDTKGVLASDNLIIQDDKDLSAEELLKIKTRERKRLQELETELQKARGERKEEQVEYSNTQSELMSPPSGQKPKVLEEPSTKPKSHMLGQVQSKQGTREAGKQFSG